MGNPLQTDFCFNLAMRKSSRLMTQFYNERLTVVGLKIGQFSILRAVDYLKETSNKELQGILIIDQTTLTRNLKPLFRDEFLQLNTNSADGRVKLISLSREGKELYRRALPIWRLAQKDICKMLGEPEAQRILSLSDSIVKTLSNS